MIGSKKLQTLSSAERQRANVSSALPNRRNGFGKTEVMVVLVVVAALIALILPAIQNARENARRQSCANNLKQLGLGLNNYHDACKVFPCSQIYTSASASQYGGKGEYALSCVTERQGPNWVTAIAPYLEGGCGIELYNKHAFFVDSAANASYRATNKPSMLCPSDANAKISYNGSGMASPAAKDQAWARGCYAANAVVNDTSMGFLAEISPAEQSPWTDDRKRGVMLPNVACRQKEITDGTSKTVLLAEIRADVGAGANRGIWAGTSGTSALFGHGSATKLIGTNANDDVGPNYNGTGGKYPTGDSTTTCDNARSAAGGIDSLVRLGMGCVVDRFDNKQSGPKSMHPGGLQTVFCDGSVHWIDDSIQTGSGTDSGYWEMLFLSADGKAVAADPFEPP